MWENYNSGVAAAPRIVIGPQTPIPPTKAAKKERISPEAEVMDEVSMGEVTMTMHGHAVSATGHSSRAYAKYCSGAQHNERILLCIVIPPYAQTTAYKHPIKA